jgi:hypothetical protein
MSSGQIVDTTALLDAGRDPLGVLRSCAPVVNAMTGVRIDSEAIERFAGTLVDAAVPPPAWDDDIHYRATGSEAIEQTIGWIMVLDALNFCFWSEDPANRWRISSGGVTHDGYLALAIALRDAARRGLPLWDPAWLANLTAATVDELLTPAPGSATIPLPEARLANLVELGRNLPAAGSPWIALVDASGWSAPGLANAVAATFPSFADTATWTPSGEPESPHTVRFLKRAQILASDLASALDALGGRSLTGRDQLTAFADYKVPQVLRHLGLIAYESELAARVDARELIAPGSRPEIEIRAATIWACELLRQSLARAGAAFTAADVDWLLWNTGQSLPATVRPYHRTLTIFY